KPSPLSVKHLASKLCSPAGSELGAPRTAAEAGSPASRVQALQEMAASTKGIALIAATRRSRAQDREGSSGRSSLHLPEDVALDSRDPKPSITLDLSPADGRWPHTSPGRDCAMERKAGRKRSPFLPWSMQPATEKLQPPSAEHVAESQPPSAPLQLSKSSGKRLFPPVPEASKIKPSFSFHAGSTDSGGQRHSLLPPSCPRKLQDGSAKRPRRPK
ncbi:hypothetical protein MC885_013574, partial [Smutsia gigantea]